MMIGMPLERFLSFFLFKFWAFAVHAYRAGRCRVCMYVCMLVRDSRGLCQLERLLLLAGDMYLYIYLSKLQEST